MTLQLRQHDWQRPPPGGGRQLTCRKCGHRQSNAPEECVPSQPTARHDAEYEPLDIDGYPV